MTTLNRTEKQIVKDFLANGGKRRQIAFFHFEPKKDGTYKKVLAGSREENNIDLFARIAYGNVQPTWAEAKALGF